MDPVYRPPIRDEIPCCAIERLVLPSGADPWVPYVQWLGERQPVALRADVPTGAAAVEEAPSTTGETGPTEDPWSRRAAPSVRGRCRPDQRTQGTTGRAARGPVWG